MRTPEETARAIVWILAGAATPCIAFTIGGSVAALTAFCFVLALVCCVYLSEARR